MDFLLGLVAPRVGKVAPNRVNNSHVPFIFLSFTSMYLARCLNIKLNIRICVSRVGTLHRTA